MSKIDRLSKSGDLLRTFVTVAECGNITHAANALGKTQSAISVQTRKLEDTLEVRLFERQARGICLTHEGEQLLPVARNIVSELGRLGSLFAEPLVGRIRVGIPDDYAETVLENVLVDFSEHHSMVEVSARFGCTSEFPKAVQRGVLDVAVVSGDDVTDECRIDGERNCWAAASGFVVDATRPVPLAVLDRAGCSWRRFGSDALEAARLSWRPAYASESFAGVRSAIRSGLAVGVLPVSLMEPSMRELSETHGYPALAMTSRGILTSDKAPAALVEAMVDAIRGATRLSARLSG